MNTDHAMVYLFIGGFKPANYYNYGLGLDLKKQLSKRFKIAVGNAIQYVERTSDYKYLDNGVRYFNPRGKISYDIWGRISVDLIVKLSCRPDIDKCIKEGQVGLTYTFKDGWK